MRALERRISRLERGAHIGADLDLARGIVVAYELVNHHPQQATETERNLAGVTSCEEWQRALSIVIRAEGGLEAAVHA